MSGLCIDMNGQGYGCSHIPTNQGSHKAKMIMGVCINIYLYWYTFKAYMLIFSAS